MNFLSEQRVRNKLCTKILSIANYLATVHKTLFEHAMTIPLVWKPKTLKDMCIYSISQKNMPYNSLPQDLTVKIVGFMYNNKQRLKLILLLTKTTFVVVECLLFSLDIFFANTFLTR